MRTLVPARAVGPWGFYLRCVAWGVATGAATGGFVGGIGGVLLLIGETFAGQALLTFVAGAVIGALVAVVPSLLGAVVVTLVVRHHHVRPTSPEAVRSDLTLLFTALVGALDAGVLVVLLVAGADGMYLLGALPYLTVVNVCVAVMLRWAGAHLSRAWAGDAST